MGFGKEKFLRHVKGRGVRMIKRSGFGIIPKSWGNAIKSTFNKSVSAVRNVVGVGISNNVRRIKPLSFKA